MALAGCGSEPTPTETQTVTVTSTAAAPSTSDSVAPTAATASEPSESDAISPSPTSTGAVPPPGQITLQTFHRPDTGQPDADVWRENVWDVADRRQQRGVRADLPFPCGGDGVRELEIRTGSRYQNLRFSVGQALDSETSTHTMTVRVLTDNKEVEIKRVPANKIQPFDRDISNVGAVRIQISVDLLPDEEVCSSSRPPVSPVLFDGYLE